jgi:hypothetical protein
MALCAEAMREWEAVEQAGRQLISVVDGIIAEASGQSNETLDEWNVACLNSVGTACRELYRPHEAAAMHLRALKLARAMGLGARAAQATRGLGRAMLIIDVSVSSVPPMAAWLRPLHPPRTNPAH